MTLQEKMVFINLIYLFLVTSGIVLLVILTLGHWINLLSYNINALTSTKLNNTCSFLALLGIFLKISISGCFIYFELRYGAQTTPLLKTNTYMLTLSVLTINSCFVIINLFQNTVSNEFVRTQLNLLGLYTIGTLYFCPNVILTCGGFFVCLNFFFWVSRRFKSSR